MSLGLQDLFVHGLRVPVLFKMPSMKTFGASWKKSPFLRSPSRSA